MNNDVQTGRLPSQPLVARPQGVSLSWLERIKDGNRLLSRVLACLVAPAALPRDEDYSRATLLVAPWEAASSVVLTFGGNTGYLMVPPGLVGLPNTHVIAIRDPKRCFALCGVSGLGETYADCLANLRLHMAELGATELFCAGVSAGGFPALRDGLDLGAAGVLGFSTRTTLDLADELGAGLANYPQLTTLYRNRPDIPLDLAGLMRKACRVRAPSWSTRPRTTATPGWPPVWEDWPALR